MARTIKLHAILYLLLMSELTSRKETQMRSQISPSRKEQPDCLTSPPYGFINASTPGELPGAVIVDDDGNVLPLFLL